MLRRAQASPEAGVGVKRAAPNPFGPAQWLPDDPSIRPVELASKIEALEAAPAR